MSSFRPSIRLGSVAWSLMTLAIVFALTLVVLQVQSSPVGAQTTPTLELQTEIDPAFGIGFDLTIRDLDTGTDPAYLGVELRLDGEFIPLGEFGELYLDCALDDDTGNDPAITHQCSFIAPGTHAAGTYEVTAYIQNSGIDVTFVESVTITEGFADWWQDYTFVELEQDIFTGSTDLTVRFNDVPAAVTDIELLAMIPTDFGAGTPGPTVPCAADAGATSWTCATTSSIPRLCVIDDIGGQYTCDGIREYYFLQANGVYMEGSDFNAVLYRLSRFQEGQFFGNLDFELGKRLDDFFDLDTFLLDDPEPCSYENRSYCFEAGYYLEWTGDYRAALPQLFDDGGAFEIAVAGSTVAVDATIPLLPLGTNGYRAEVAYESADDPGVWTELLLTCQTDTCDQLSIPALADGTYNFELRVYNDHPFTEYPDTGYPSFGQTLEATIAYGAPVVIGVVAPTCNGLAVTVDLGSGDFPTPGDDVILGTSGPDVIFALAGNDTICGLGGDDAIYAGDGDDWVDADDGDDFVIGADGNDQILGRAGDDVVAGNKGDDQLSGGVGFDVVYGGSGADSVMGGDGDDVLGSSSGDDTVSGGSGDDTISGGSGSDVIDGEAGNDLINAGGGDDTTVLGGDGDDLVSGNKGDDVVNGNAGNDQVRGGPGNDVVNGDEGDDFVAGNLGVDVCDGGTETTVDTAAPNCETVINVP